MYDVTTWLTNNCAIHIFTNISRNKGNQAIKFRQLTEYNMKNIFLEKSYLKCGRETSSRPFSKKSNWAYLWINILKFYVFCLIVCQVEDYRKWFELSSRPFAFTSYKAFLKNKKRSETSLPTSFPAWFLKKSISLVLFY